jgi:hypothetical protein
MFDSRLMVSKPSLFSQAIPGKVEVAIAPDQPGRVAFRGSFYPAKLYQTNTDIILEPGQTCQVIGRESITLLVAV